MKKIMLIGMVLGILAMILTGCSDFCEDCNDKIDSAQDDYGAGDCSLSEWDDGTWCYDCWWWSYGVSKTFCQWDSCDCDEYTYTFITTDEDMEKTEYKSLQIDGINFRFADIVYHENNAAIPFAADTHLTEMPVVECGGEHTCKVDYTIHDSGISTGVIYVPVTIDVVNFNGHEIAVD